MGRNKVNNFSAVKRENSSSLALKRIFKAVCHDPHMSVLTNMSQKVSNHIEVIFNVLHSEVKDME